MWLAVVSFGRCLCESRRKEQKGICLPKNVLGRTRKERDWSDAGLSFLNHLDFGSPGDEVFFPIVEVDAVPSGASFFDGSE